jgi:hypothetical protein
MSGFLCNTFHHSASSTYDNALNRQTPNNQVTLGVCRSFGRNTSRNDQVTCARYNNISTGAMLMVYVFYASPAKVITSIPLAQEDIVC